MLRAEKKTLGQSQNGENFRDDGGQAPDVGPMFKSVEIRGKFTSRQHLNATA